MRQESRASNRLFPNFPLRNAVHFFDFHVDDVTNTSRKKQRSIVRQRFTYVNWSIDLVSLPKTEVQKKCISAKMAEPLERPPLQL